MRKLNFALLVLVLVFAPLLTVTGGFTPAQAQAITDPPLILLMDGDLWAYTESLGTLRQLTRWGYNQLPVVAPDNNRIAYASVAEIAIDALRRQGESPNQPPANIWIWDVSTGNAVRVAQQPPTASFGAGYPTETFVRRSAPTWSPDGTMLAWIEESVTQTANQSSSVPQLVIYDVKLGAVRATAALSNPNALAYLGPLWGANGIAVRVPLSGAGGTSGDIFQFYDNNGLRRLEVNLPSQNAIMIDYRWVNHMGQEYLGTAFSTNKWVLINPVNALTLDAPSVPELFAVNSPAGVSARWLVDQSSIRWIATGNGQDVPLNFNGFPTQFAIAPSGQALAYIADAVYILRGGKTTRIAGTERVATNRIAYLAWGYMNWRSSRATTAPPAPTPLPLPTQAQGAGTCVGAPAARLAPNMSARVTLDPPRPNSLNTQPAPPSRSPNSAQLGLIPAGSVVTVLAGPVCSFGFQWYQVNFNGQVGWTAEGEAGVYWMEPYGGPAPSACAPNLPPRLIIGSQGRVTPGVPNAIRSGPSRQNGVSSVVGTIPGGGVFNVLNGPICGDGLTWWQVSYLGVTGWTAEGENFTYWLEPLYCGLQVPSRMRAGGMGRVTPGLPNALRSQPSTNDAISVVIGSIPGGGIFTVIQGPACGDGMAWWQVNYNGIIGWTSEGQGTTYWLEPQ